MNLRKRPDWDGVIRNWWGLADSDADWLGPRRIGSLYFFHGNPEVLYSGKTALAKRHPDGLVTMQERRRSLHVSRLRAFLITHGIQTLVVEDPLCVNHDKNLNRFHWYARCHAKSILNARKHTSWRKQRIEELERDYRFYCERFGLRLLPLLDQELRDQMTTKLIRLTLEGVKT